MSNVIELAQIDLHGSATTPTEAIEEAAAILVAAGAVTDEYVTFMLERETLVSTYMGNFLAIPHGTNDGKDTILKSALSFVRYDEPIDWAGSPVRFVVGIAGKDGGHPGREGAGCPPGREFSWRRSPPDRRWSAGAARRWRRTPGCS